MSQKQEVHVAFVLACNASHEDLRRVARSAPEGERWATCRDVLLEAGVFMQRERLLVTASPAVVIAAETVQRYLVAIRDLIGAGENLEGDAYGQAYALYANSLWQLRQSMRVDADSPVLDLSDPVLIREQLPPRDAAQRRDGH
ncbi:hypothetical protein [Streptomyces sp. NPDC085540]|uniref:hypothetical protein n=1 Tax=Streptomyces sp. NPDC085540 TaxID=3365730 RepID=UPI0037D95CA8